MSTRTNYVYYIVYSAVKSGYPITGTCSLARNKKLNTMAEIKAAAEYLKKEWSCDDFLITNFILLNKKGIV